MRNPKQSTLLQRAKAYVSRSCGPTAGATTGAAAMVIVPLAAATPVEAGYMKPWNFASAGMHWTNSDAGTVSRNLTVEATPGGSTASGSAVFTLNRSALTEIDATYSGLGAGDVQAGDAVEFTWDFEIVETGAAPVQELEWELVGYYSQRFTPLVYWPLGSGTSFGGSTGSAIVTFPQNANDMNWHGMKMEIQATVAGTQPGQYAFRVDVDKLQYAYLPEPASLAAVSLTAALVLGRRGRGNG